MNLQRFFDKASCYTLLLLIILYYSQGVLIPEGGIGQIILIIIFIISFLYLIKMLLMKEKFNSFLRIWLFFLFIYIVYFIIYGDFSEFNLLKMVLLNFLPFFPFYYFSQKGLLTRKHLLTFFIILLPVFIIKFQQSLAALRIERMRDEVVDNTVYLFIGLLPFTFLFRNKLLSIFFLIVIWFFMIQSAKRAAIVCGGIALMLIVFDYMSSLKSTSIKRYFYAIVFLGIIGYFGYDFYEKNEYLISRMQDAAGGDTSGRDYLISTLFGFWMQSDSAFRYLFGFGYNSSGLYSTHVSHNDWIDMLISFGFLGLFLYFNLFRLLFLQLFRKNWIGNKRIILILFICIALITSLTSRWYWSSFAFMQILILPYLLATSESEL